MDETEKMDKQIRLRCTAVERAHIDKAAKEAGCTTVSEYVRSLLFDKHVLIVGPSDPPLTLIPAWSTDDVAKEEALLMVRGMIALAETAQAVDADETVLPPIFEEPAVDLYHELPNNGNGPEPVEAPFPPIPTSPVEDSFVMPPPQLAAVPPVPSDPNYLPIHPPPPLPAPAEIGPIPLPEENRNAFINRRVLEMQLHGESSLMAATIAEAEWRQAEAGPVVPPQSATVPRGPQEFPVDRPRGPGAPEPMSQNGHPGTFDAPPTHGFCGSCGKALAGTPFCSGCGTPV